MANASFSNLSATTSFIVPRYLTTSTLPATAGNEGAIVMATSNHVMYYANGTSWVPMSGGGGSQGYQGDNGAQGAQGSPGAQGGPGAQGSNGQQGVLGMQGRQGSPGVGFQGNQGAIGSQGNQGFQGSAGTGSQGFQGFQGNQGFQGAVGVGSQGNQGSQGFQGAQGNQGAQGDAGVGAQGAQGNPGTYAQYGFNVARGAFETDTAEVPITGWATTNYGTYLGANTTFDTTTGVFTVPVTGIYEFDIVVPVTTVATVTANLGPAVAPGIILRKTNGTPAILCAANIPILDVNILVIQLRAVLGSSTVSMSIMSQLTAGDTLQLVYVPGGLTIPLNLGDNSATSPVTWSCTRLS